MTRLLAFYRSESPDSEGRMIDTIWDWDDALWEDVHDFIQWLFPLPEPSQFNPDAPLLTSTDMTAFHQDAFLKERLRRSYVRFLCFVGLALSEDGQVIESPHFATRAADVWVFPNHNWLRFSRVLRSLTLLGLSSEARAFFVWLEQVKHSKRFPIRADTFGYWERAVQLDD